MESHEKLENAMIEFTKVTFLGGPTSNCGYSEEEIQKLKEEYGEDFIAPDTLYGGGSN